MEKIAVEPFKSQYVKLVKDNKEVLDGTIIDILEDSIIFQTELGRRGISMDSIREIISYEEIKKKKKMRRELKADNY